MKKICYRKVLSLVQETRNYSSNILLDLFTYFLNKPVKDLYESYLNSFPVLPLTLAIKKQNK